MTSLNNHMAEWVRRGEKGHWAARKKEGWKLSLREIKDLGR